MPSRYWLYFTGFVLSTIAFLAVSLLGVMDALSVFSGGMYYEGEIILLAMIFEAFEWILAALVVGVIGISFLAATVISVLRTKAPHRNEKFVPIVERLEREYPILKQFDAAEKVEPTTQERKEKITQQYVDGEISDQEFEREMEQLLGDEEDVSVPADEPENRRSTDTTTGSSEYSDIEVEK